jgi:hypothetical protein
MTNCNCNYDYDWSKILSRAERWGQQRFESLLFFGTKYR